MNRKEYIEKAKQSIINRVKFHAPILYDDNIDRRVLFESGFDINIPVFKFDKTLNKALFESIKLAQKECDFRAVFSLENLGNIRENKLKKLKNYFVYSKYSSANLIENINKLNINYQSSSNYDLKYKDKFFKVNGVTLNPNFNNFVLKCENVFDGVAVEYKEFVLNGNNVFLKYINTTDKMQKIDCEFNFLLKNGYYMFKKQEKCVFVENIVTNESNYFNFECKGAKLNFSAVDGLENSKYCCVNVKYCVTLKPRQIAYSFFNFGNQKFLPQNLNLAEKFCILSQKMCFCEFDLLVKTKDFKFDEYFNKTLPKKIWLGWLEFERFDALEDKYKTYRKLFLKGKDKISFANFAQLGVREVFVFNGEIYKKISVVLSNEKFLKIGRVLFSGMNCVSLKSLKTKETVTLSLG